MKKDIKNFKKSRKMWFFHAAVVRILSSRVVYRGRGARSGRWEALIIA
jgi:hypothetical protein